MHALNKNEPRVEQRPQRTCSGKIRSAFEFGIWIFGGMHAYMR